jgi:hypothetical protein
MSALTKTINKIFILLTLSFLLVFSTNLINKVKVGVYYESLCPYSRSYVMNQLIPTWHKLSSIMTLNMNIFGNCYVKILNKTVEPPEVEFECQHGLQECIGNTIMVFEFFLSLHNPDLLIVSLCSSAKYLYQNILKNFKFENTFSLFRFIV